MLSRGRFQFRFSERLLSVGACVWYLVGMLALLWHRIPKARKMGAYPVLTVGGWVCGVEKPKF